MDAPVTPWARYPQLARERVAWLLQHAKTAEDAAVAYDLTHRALLLLPITDARSRSVVYMRLAALSEALDRPLTALRECTLAVESSADDNVSALARVVRGRALRRMGVSWQGRLAQALEADPTPWQSTVQPENRGPVLLRLPPECTLRIFSYLRGYELAAVSQVCRAWRALAHDERLWQHVTFQQWGRACVLAAETAGTGAPLAHPQWTSWRALHVGRHVRLFARPPVVMDCGSGYCRIGFAGEVQPRAVFSMATAMQATTAGIHWTFDFWSAPVVGMADVVLPFTYGCLAAPDCLLNLLMYVYAEVLHTAPQAQTVVVAQCPWQTDRYTDAAYNDGRDRFMQILFEGLRVPAVVLANGAVLSLLAHGASEGLVIDIGFVSTRVVPIVAGRIVRSGVLCNQLGGGSVTNALTQFMNYRGQRLSNFDQIMVVKVVKEETAYVSLSPATEQAQQVVWRGVGEDAFVLDFERFLCTELLVRPEHMAGLAHAHGLQLGALEERGIPELMRASLDHVESTARARLLQSVVLTGGSAALPGLAERIAAEANARVHTPLWGPRELAVWCGGSLLGTTPALEMHATTLAQYVAAGGWNTQPTELGMPVHAF